MKRIAKVAGLLLIVGVAFVAGAITVAVNQPQARVVTVEIRNNSEKDIKEIELNEAHGTILKISGVPARKSRTLWFFYPGETSYSLRVVFKDNTEIKGGGLYVEPGFSTVETITKAKIKSEYKKLFTP